MPKTKKQQNPNTQIAQETQPKNQKKHSQNLESTDMDMHTGMDKFSDNSNFWKSITWYSRYDTMTQ